MAAARKSFPKARWATPAVLVNAEFRGKTGEGLLRHPAFKTSVLYLRSRIAANIASCRSLFLRH
jgi:hypothetical protein